MCSQPYKPQPDTPGPQDQTQSNLASLTALWRQIESFSKRPVEEKEALLGELGVPAESSESIIDLLDQLRQESVTEPGLVFDPKDPCDIGWQPSVLAPVFYGTHDFDKTDGAPARMRVFYPSLDGAPRDAPLLDQCGRYPLVLFLHGQCIFDDDHYLVWDILPAQLARSGYVVVVPELGSHYPWGEDNPDLALATDVLDWMRRSWAHAGVLLPPWSSAIVGHSYGAMLGARLAAQVPVAAYASLSGGWLEWPSTSPSPLPNIGIASLFTWGNGFGDVHAALEGSAAGLWEQPTGARHKVVFADGGHWDYLRKNQTQCESFGGDCALVPSLAADFVTTFLSHYVPPEKWSLLPYTIPHSLIPPSLDLTDAQKFFVGGHLFGFDQIDSSPTCSVTHTWNLPWALSGSVTLSGS